MKSILRFAAVAATLAISHAAEIGQAAPAISAKDTKGMSIDLAALKGKVVVLEWINFDCPFVKKHYASGNLPKLQQSAAAKEVVWISVNSSAEGKQGHLAAADLETRATTEGSKAAHLLVDADGTVGKAYGAKVTPHLFIIGKDGKLAYDGAIDSKASTDAKDIASAVPLFANALDAVTADKEVADAKNKPYGCGVKY
jgi:peroxiredoxin